MSCYIYKPACLITMMFANSSAWCFVSITFSFMLCPSLFPSIALERLFLVNQDLRGSILCNKIQLCLLLKTTCLSCVLCPWRSTWARPIVTPGSVICVIQTGIELTGSSACSCSTSSKTRWPSVLKRSRASGLEGFPTLKCFCFSSLTL